MDKNVHRSSEELFIYSALRVLFQGAWHTRKKGRRRITSQRVFEKKTLHLTIAHNAEYK